MIPKSGYRFPAFANRLRPKADFGGQEPAPACAKPKQLRFGEGRSAGEGRSEKIMLKQEARARLRFHQKR
jgi:hypothetical protein